jgi:hypothetical protein
MLKMISYLFEIHNDEQDCHIISYIVKEYENIYHETISAETIRTAVKGITNQSKDEQKYPLVLYTDGIEMQSKIAKLFNFFIPKGCRNNSHVVLTRGCYSTPPITTPNVG